MTDATKLALPGDWYFEQSGGFGFWFMCMPNGQRAPLCVGISRDRAEHFAAAMNKAVDDAYAAGLDAAKQEAQHSAWREAVQLIDDLNTAVCHEEALNKPEYEELSKRVNAFLSSAPKKDNDDA